MFTLRLGRISCSGLVCPRMGQECDPPNHASLLLIREGDGFSSALGDTTQVSDCSDHRGKYRTVSASVPCLSCSEDSPG